MRESFAARRFQSDNRSSDAFVRSFLQGGADDVDISGCIELTDESCGVIARACPGLRSLRVAGTTGFRVTRITDEGLCRLAEACGCLERVELNSCAAITDATTQVRFVPTL